jgi:hypothetical protein
MPSAPIGASSAAQPPRAWGSIRILNRWTGLAVVCLLIGLLGGFITGKRIGFTKAANLRRQMPNGSILCKTGPWGDLSYTPFTIAAPDALLPVRAIEANGTHWFFNRYTAASFAALLQSTSLPPDQRRALLDPAVLHVRTDGVDLTPPPDLVISLPDDARAAIYQILAQSPENGSGIHFIRKDTVADLFADSGVSPDTVNLFKRLCWEHGNYLVFAGLPAVLSRLPAYQDKLHFLKALTRQRTMLLRLRITPTTDVQALAQYWAKGSWDTDVLTIFRSLTTIPNGSWMSILMVLPPLPTAELYNYPGISAVPSSGAPINQDSHWTSLNFFRDVPDPNFGKAEYVLRELKETYFPATGDPRYGDVVLFTRPDGTMIHSAVYVADDICFTRNGNSATDPWMLSTIADLLDQFSCRIPPDQQITVSYFRSKNL